MLFDKKAEIIYHLSNYLNDYMLSEQELAKFNKLLQKQDDRLPIIFNTLGDPNRCKIFRLFLKDKATSLCVSDIAKLLKVSIPAISQHLKILQITGLVTRERRGKQVYFKVCQGDKLIDTLIKAVL